MREELPPGAPVESSGDSPNVPSANGDGPTPDSRAAAVQFESCEEHGLLTEELEPEVMILLDRSASMTGGWDDVRAAVQALTEDFDERARFGLTVFPEDIACDPGRVLVEPAINAGADIERALSNIVPDGLTPTDGALSEVAQHFEDNKGPLRYVVLVTDGGPTCVGDAQAPSVQAASEAALEAMEALTDAGVRTYVLGIQTPEAAGVLDALAEAGGTGEDEYRELSDHAAVGEALVSITQDALECNFVLDAPADNPQLVRVRMDGEALPFEDEDGWRLGADNQTIFLVGRACSDLQKGSHELAIEILCEA